MSNRAAYWASLPTRAEIEAFHRMTDEEKFLAGPRLFDLECKIAMGEIRKRNPDANEDEVRRILRDRIELERRLDEAGIYVPMPLPTTGRNAHLGI